MGSFKRFAGNLALFGSSLLLVMLACEWLFPRVFPYLLPLDAADGFEETYGVSPVLAATKRGFLPEDYIALVGDSYAMGMGDETMEKIRTRRPLYGSAPVIQAMTGRDVITYGQPGAGSLRGLVSHPVSGQLYLRSRFGGPEEDPAWIVLFFYEGNDLVENWMYFERTFLPYAPAAAYDDPDTFQRYVQDVVLGRHHLYLAATRPRWVDRWLFPRFVWRVLYERFTGRPLPRYRYPGEFGLVYVAPERWMPSHVAQPHNHAQIAGQPVPLPDNLQGPALDLDSQQRQHALGTFDKALAQARTAFPHSRFAVAYVPSVLATYTLASDIVHVQNYLGGKQLFPATEVATQHAALLEAVGAICARQGVPFVDTTPALREAARQQPIHGPKDWNHLTQHGYEVLGQSVVAQLPALRPDGSR